MKLKNLLHISFLSITIVPIIIVSVLAYNSCYNLSSKAYISNLEESITVQVDNISQIIQNNLVIDYRFANKTIIETLLDNTTNELSNNEIHTIMQSYLNSSEDKITTSLILNKDNDIVYSIGDKQSVEVIKNQAIALINEETQSINEFTFPDKSYSLGIITPIHDKSNNYLGSFVSVYDKSYLLKILSSYYNIAESSSVVCRSDGSIVSFKDSQTTLSEIEVQKSLYSLSFNIEDTFSLNIDESKIIGYYKNINNTPWYVLGIIENSVIVAFASQFIYLYLIMVFIVILLDVLLSFYFANKVVGPINNLIVIMDNYKNNPKFQEIDNKKSTGYFETNYLRTKFFELMKSIKYAEHNYQGIYQLYQSSDMGDINVDIDTINQTIHSNKKEITTVMEEIEYDAEDCVVDKFAKCFVKNDSIKLKEIFVSMRDKHLSGTKELEIFTSYLNERWFHTVIVPTYENGRLSHLFIQLRDISNFKRQENEAKEQARKDSLTRLYNRHGFLNCVEKIINNCDFSAQHGLLFIDMDYFKLVNDHFGHVAGDELLQKIANILLSIAPKECIVSRIGGDEFTLFLPNTNDEKLNILRNQIQQALIFTYNNENISIEVTSSIGISIWSSESKISIEDLMKIADKNMYAAKREFKQQKTTKKD